MLWQDCQGERYITEVTGRLYRLVESQVQVATLSYVDTLAEQALLEQMLEQVKPPTRTKDATLHYLLQTPFRYPPLKWGSRFGPVYEPGIFYGGCSVEVTLAESAYYRFVFWYSMTDTDNIPKPSMRSEHTLFSVGYHSHRAIQLHQPPFVDYQSILTDKADYLKTQQLGSAMLAAGVEAFEYQSARATGIEYCVGLFTPATFATNQPEHSSQWLCELSAEQVLFKQAGNSTLYPFNLAQFQLNGVLPIPA